MAQEATAIGAQETAGEVEARLAGLGAKLEVARELGVSTIQLHAPAAASRTAQRAREFLTMLGDLGIAITAVFGGFAGGCGVGRLARAEN